MILELDNTAIDLTNVIMVNRSSSQYKKYSVHLNTGIEIEIHDEQARDKPSMPMHQFIEFWKRSKERVINCNGLNHPEYS